MGGAAQRVQVLMGELEGGGFLVRAGGRAAGAQARPFGLDRRVHGAELDERLPLVLGSETGPDLGLADEGAQRQRHLLIVVFDRQYSPFIFTLEDETIIPAESVYAVFEAKQTVDAGMVTYAQKKIASVRRLHRTSLPIPYA